MVISTSVILAKLSAVWTINARICKGSGTHDSDKSLLFRCLRHCRRLALLHCAGRCDLLRTAWAKPLRSPGIRRCLARPLSTGHAGLQGGPTALRSTGRTAPREPGICRSEEHTSELQSLMRNSYD